MRSYCGEGTCLSRGREVRCSGSMCRRLGGPSKTCRLRYRSAKPLPRPARVISGWSVPQRRPPHLAQRLKHTAAPYERRDGDRRLARAAEVRALSEVFSRTSPVRVTSDRAEHRRVTGPPARSPGWACGSTTGVVHSFSTARWGMNDGPELPGEFVSDELRNDCVRFLHELRRLVELRRQPTPDNAAWDAGRLSDPQSPPNSRSSPS
jgi:hypothetical protein